MLIKLGVIYMTLTKPTSKTENRHWKKKKKKNLSKVNKLSVVDKHKYNVWQRKPSFKKSQQKLQTVNNLRKNNKTELELKSSGEDVKPNVIHSLEVAAVH